MSGSYRTEDAILKSLWEFLKHSLEIPFLIVTHNASGTRKDDRGLPTDMSA